MQLEFIHAGFRARSKPILVIGWRGMTSIEVWAEPEILAMAGAELEVGLTVHPFDEQSQPKDLDVAIVRGASRARELAIRWPDVCVVAVVSSDELSAVDEAVDDFVCAPLNPGELALRITRVVARSERDLRGRLLARAVEFAGDIMEISNPRAVIQYVNPAFTRVLGYTAQQIIGKTPAQLQRSDAHSPEFFKNIDATLSAGKVWSGLLISRDATGNLVHLDSTIAPVSNSRGIVTHHVAVKRDVTERVHRERALEETNKALRKARDAALRANQTKSEFLANMSHELRTPLNAVIGYSELLMEDVEDSPALLSDLKKIHGAGTHLLSLINDVLDMSKIESGKMELDITDVELPTFLESIRATITPLAAKQNNALLLDIQHAPSNARTDTQKLRQVLLNLMSNACKFTTDGKVTLTVTEEPQGWLRLRVQDTGIGLTEEQRSKIFRPFVQADTSTTRKYGGTGLGLAISLRFCEMLGGRIELSSEVGVGSTFEVNLPLNYRPQSFRPKSLTPDGTEALVLVIDDDQLTFDVLNRNLTEKGCRVEWAATGEAGLAAAKRLSPHIIVLDVIMPGMDGWSVLTGLKESPETQDIPVVMLTMLEQAELGVAMGAVDYLVKPVRAGRLVSAIGRWLDTTRAEHRVLVVEDDVALREIAERSLSGAGYGVHTAANGLEALQALEEIVPDLIVLDLMMPEMDGFQFLHELRQRPQFDAVPVVVTTAKELTNDEQTLLQASAQRVIQKMAHSRTELLVQVERQIGLILSAERQPSSRRSLTAPNSVG